MSQTTTGDLVQAAPYDMDRATSTTELLYTYKPLQGNEIRLLNFSLKSAYNAIFDPTAPLDLHTEVVDLNEARPDEHTGYFALSYTWGDGKADRLIFLDGKCHFVTPNLESALRELLRQQLRPLWIDAISINQDETNSEKSGQVAKMGDIYAQAIAVIVWLGEETTGSELAIDFIEENFEVDQITGYAISKLLEKSVKELEYIPAWIALGQDLLRRPWWKRMWVIQEIASARQARILCGSRLFHWHKLWCATRVAWDHGLDIFQSDDGYNLFWTVENKSEYRFRRHFGEPRPLQELLINNISSSAKDPRDMIFSLLGIVTDVEDAPELRADYSLSVETVYTNFVKFNVRKYQCLDIICKSKHPKKLKNLPSWVPDWSNVREKASLGLPNFSPSAEKRGCYIYRASQGRPPDYEFLANDTILSVEALLIDKISQMGTECSRGNGQFYIDIVSWQSLVFNNMKEPYIGGGNLITAFNRTTCADHTRAGMRAQPGERGIFEAMAMAESGELPASFRNGMGLTLEERQDEWKYDAIKAVTLRATRRRLIITGKGYMGLGPPDSAIGDVVAILIGCNVPVILRPRGESWFFVSEAYVCGIMDGELMPKESTAEVERTESSKDQPNSIDLIIQRILLV
jgi:heterokaryon incompatibility protein (HET)